MVSLSFPVDNMRVSMDLCHGVRPVHAHCCTIQCCTCVLYHLALAVIAYYTSGLRCISTCLYIDVQ